MVENGIDPIAEESRTSAIFGCRRRTFRNESTLKQEALPWVATSPEVEKLRLPPHPRGARGMFLRR